MVTKENLFFFTDNDHFRSTRFEYTSEKNLEKGFVFGLMTPEPFSFESKTVSDLEGKKITSFSHEGSNVDLLTNLNKMNNFRELKNLGSTLKDVRPYDSEGRSGYEVLYGDGDICTSDPSKRYETWINYQCDTTSESKLHDYPMLVPQDLNYRY